MLANFFWRILSWVRVEGSALINRPVEDVWTFISNPKNLPKWDPRTLEVRQTSEGPVGLGTTFQGTVQHLGRRVMNARIIEYEPNKNLGWEFTSGLIRGSKVNYTMDSVEGKTRLTRVFELRVHRIWKIIQPILARGAKRNREAEVTEAKRFLEA